MKLPDRVIGQIRVVGSNDRISVNRQMAIIAFLNVALERLNLRDWHVYFYLDDTPDSETSTATINVRTGSKVAGLWLSDKFFDTEQMPDDLRQQTLIHELLHLHFEDAWAFVDDVIDNELHPHARSPIEISYKRHLEVGIDQLAFALNEHMNLPLFGLPDE